MMLLTFLKKHKFFILGLVVLSWVVFINIFPDNVAITSSDTSQFINLKENAAKVIYDVPSYMLAFLTFSFFDKIGASTGLQLSIWIAIFIFLSYLSFYTFIRIIFERLSSFYQSALSLFYALNIFTLYIFTMHSLGYTYFFSLYIFTPLLIGFYLKFLIDRRLIFLALFCLILFFSSPGFGNPAFALSLGILLFALTILLFFFKLIKFDRKTLAYILLILLLSLLISSFWLFPVVPQMRDGVTALNTTNPVNLNNALRSAANPIYDTIAFSKYTHDFFPHNFQYSKIFFLKKFFIIISYLPILIICFLIIFIRKKGNEGKFIIIFSILLFIFIALSAKVTPPFEKTNYYFFNLWGMNTMRTFDKNAIFLPFVFATLLAIFFFNLEKRKHRKLGILLMFLILLAPLPFYVGKLQQTVSSRFSEDKNYKTSKLTFLIKIPDEYYSIKELLNNDKEKVFIATLPYNMGDSGTGASNYPKWKMNGVDITQHLYNKKFIEANASYFPYPSWYFTKNFNDEDGDYDWIPKILGIMNSKYILYHKDSTEDSVLKTSYKMDSLEKDELIKKLNDNDYFTLYVIRPDLVLPYISYQNKIFDWRNDPVWIGRNAENIKNASAQADFKEINPKKFEIDFKKSDFSKNIILAEKYDPLWKAYIIDTTGKKTEIKNHFLARGYANGWTLPENQDDISKIIIEYYPIKLMWIGIWISGMTVLFLLGYLVYYYYRESHSERSEPACR